jgi:uncharacterized protein (DUF433 family)
MTALGEARLTVPEAAFVVGLPTKAINREIDAKIISASGTERRLRFSDLLYLRAIKNVRDQVGPTLRKSFQRAIASAAANGQHEARCHHFVFAIDELRNAILVGLQQLQRATERHVEERPEVLNGEPVLKGTRIAVRQIADLVRQGATSEELQEDFDLSAEQVEAAVIYDRARPKRGRPLARRSRTSHVPPAR